MATRASGGVGWCSRDDARRYTTEPMIVVEVPSPSTRDHDRERRLRFCKALPTLRHIVFIHEIGTRVERCRRSPDGWSKETLPTDGDVFRLEAVLSEMGLGAFYDGAAFGNG